MVHDFELQASNVGMPAVAINRPKKLGWADVKLLAPPGIRPPLALDAPAQLAPSTLVGFSLRLTGFDSDN
jgi:hypothetical protein